uniref:AMP-dependent synthetase/ligase domain-containing protein n=1 Tax=Rhodococcus sp. NS1 TaxID=402236 RepID=A0A097SQL2_9NOCA|nr:hypothetical protein LRS1606.394 [Rhodococcus sp. NS1]
MTKTFDALRTAGDRVVLRDLDGRDRTGNELLESVSQIAGTLVDTGLKEAVIGCWYTNSIAAVEAALAIEWIGGTRVPVDPNSTALEAQSTWAAARVQGYITDISHAGQVDGTAIVHDDRQPAHGRFVPPVENVPDSRTHLLYPRAVQSGELLGVPISYGNWETTMSVNESLYRTGGYGPGFGDDECFLTVQQIMHGTGLVGTFPFIRMGLPQIVVPGFDVGVVLDLFASGEVTSTMMVTAMVERIADRLQTDPRSTGRLRRLLYGGAPMPREKLVSAAKKLPGTLVQVYGRLEGGWPLAILDQHAHDAIAVGDPRVGSCGRPIAESDFMLRPSGEIAVRSGMVVQQFSDSDQWCGLGDIASADDDGFIYIHGRLDRMINTGYHVYPAEIEEAIRAVPGVIDVEVKGIPDPNRGERVVAVVRARPEQQTGLVDAVDRHLRTVLAAYKVPREYMLIDAT